MEATVLRNAPEEEEIMAFFEALRAEDHELWD